MNARYLAQEAGHLDKTHKRWLRRAKYQERATPEDQCGQCRYYIYLSEAFRNDWGVCSHPDSPHDGTAMFEHDGCPLYVSPYER